MFRWSGAQPSGAFLAMFTLAACVPLEKQDDGCQETVYNQDPNTGQVTQITLPCRRSSPSDPDPKAPPGSACDDLDDQLGRVVELTSGTSPFVDAFFTESYIIVVAKDRVELFDRSGQRHGLVRWENDADGSLDTAAFDGSTLGIAAGGDFVSYNANLIELARGRLSAECTSSVLVNGHHFVCGGAEERGRTFYVYDTLTGADRFGSTHDAFEEGPMERVRGREAFLTVNTNTAPRSFSMYSVATTGRVTMTGKSDAANHGTFRISPLYAFPDDPATHLVTDAGLLVCLTPEDCSDPTYGLLPEDDIAQLAEGTCFGAMDVDAAGKLHGIVGPVDDALYDTPSCEQGCVAERLDLATGAVEASMPFEVNGTLEALRADPQGGVLLACGPGHRVLLLPDAP